MSVDEASFMAVDHALGATATFVGVVVALGFIIAAGFAAVFIFAWIYKE